MGTRNHESLGYTKPTVDPVMERWIFCFYYSLYHMDHMPQSLRVNRNGVGYKSQDLQGERSFDTGGGRVVGEEQVCAEKTTLSNSLP